MPAARRTLEGGDVAAVGGGGSAGLLVSGAMAARARHDYSLTERLARAAIEAGAGFEARFMAAEAAHLQRRSDQAEQELAALAAHATSDAEKARVALLRFDNVFLEGSADLQIIDDTLAVITDPFWRDELANRRLFVTAIVKRAQGDMEAASTWIQRPDSASRGAMLHALIRMGRLDEAIEELTPPPGTQSGPCARRAVAPVVAVRPPRCRARLLRPSRRGGRAPHHGVSRSHGPSGGRSESFRRR